MEREDAVLTGVCGEIHNAKVRVKLIASSLAGVDLYPAPDVSRPGFGFTFGGPWTRNFITT